MISLDVRPEVAAFARLMEAKLRENDHKGGWQHDDASALLARLHEELDELGRCDLWRAQFGIAGNVKVEPSREKVRLSIGREAADVANFAMMIADVCGAFIETPRSSSPPSSGAAGPGEVTDRCAECRHTVHSFDCHAVVVSRGVDGPCRCASRRSPTSMSSGAPAEPARGGPPWDTARDASGFEPLCYLHGGVNLTPNAVARPCSASACNLVTFGVQAPTERCASPGVSGGCARTKGHSGGCCTYDIDEACKAAEPGPGEGGR